MSEPTPSLDALRERLATERGPRYWRSLEELSETREFREVLEREFPRHASEWDEGVSRRRVFELMAASLSLAGLTACTRQPRELIVPYVRQPEDVVPGQPLYFATAMPLGRSAVGLLVESHEGRPTKVEGNPDHPSSLGASDQHAQASPLGLYDPDRAQTITRLGEIRTWAAFVAELTQRLGPQRALGGAGVRILTESISSPALEDQLRGLLAAFPRAKWTAWDAVSRENVLAGAEAAFGERVEAVYDFGAADVVVLLDADPLAEGPGSSRYARDFSRRRRAFRDGGSAVEPSRLYAIESAPTSSATIADHRLALAPRDVARASAALAAAVGAGAAGAPGRWDAFVAAAAADLKAAAGRSLVVAGDYAPAEVHALAHAMNAALGNAGKTVRYVEGAPKTTPLAELVADMVAGSVDVLLVVGGNPVYDAPAELGFTGAMAKVPFRVRLGLYDDETSAHCHWHLPAAHDLEAWSDARGHDGTVSIVQPLIQPLYGGRSVHELLEAFSEGPQRPPLEIVRAFWKRQRPSGDFEALWRKALHDGVVPDTALPARSVTARGDAAAAAAAAIAAWPAPPAGSLEIAFRPDPGVWDGRFANNGWLQELPRPLSKVTWDNAAYVGVETAKALGIALPVDWTRTAPAPPVDPHMKDVVSIAVNGAAVELPVWVLPGHAEGSVTLHLGFGRTRSGRVGNGVGVDVYPIRRADTAWHAAGAAVTKTGKKAALVSTQHHFLMEGRALVRSGTLETFRKEPEFAKHMAEAPPRDMTLHGNWPYDNYAWGMSVDLNVCTGCSACVIACQAENNIPVVGKDQVRRGREMHWLRIDRYYEGTAEDPELHNQPVMCMHCEKAPCEVVCPVAATSHSDEGLNEMTYNRCVGTKYCSNNCPYKVRRFNFYEFNTSDEFALVNRALPVLQLLANPDVTVRQRGVMEKCSFCVQRINAVRIAAQRESRKIKDGEVVPACAQACPMEALVFGDLNDAASRVAVRKASPLAYGLLEELNTRPRTTYEAKVTNPSAAMPARHGAPAGGHARPGGHG